MSKQKWPTILINLIGGTVVLGSYAIGLSTHPAATQVLWGGVPGSIRPLYTASMALAASGYFAFTYFILFRLDVDATQVAGRFGFWVFNALYAAILLPSALWMPLTFWAIGQPSPIAFWSVRAALAVVGLASLGLFAALLKVSARQPLWAHRLALIGCAAFCLQTALLDAVLWSAFFQM
jgi:hypothetical protein